MGQGMYYESLWHLIETVKIVYISLLILIKSEASSKISSLSIMLKLAALSSGNFFASRLYFKNAKISPAILK